MNQPIWTPPGKPMSTLFGHGSTEMLMFIALNPGCTGRKIRAALNLGENGPWTRAIRLRRLGLLYGHYRYQINPNLDYRRYLVHFLRALGIASGFAEKHAKSRMLNNMAREDPPIAAPLPDCLFGTEARTKVLMFLASIEESYNFEMHHVLSMHDWPLLQHFRALTAEGVVRKRVFRGVKMFNLDPTYPAASELRTILRYMAGERKYMIGALNAALLRRERLRQTSDPGHKEIIENLMDSRDGSRMIFGIKIADGKRLARELDFGA